MPTDSELLTPAEAAVVARVNIRDVHRMIDEHILPKQFYVLAKGRRLRAAACPFVGFYVHEANRLTKEERGVLIHRVCNRMSAEKTRWSIRRWRRDSGPRDWTVGDGALTVSLWHFVTSADERHNKLAEARAMVVEDAEILGGTPVIQGTRIPVFDVAASVVAGLPASRIKAAYPGLDDRMLELAALYTEATPPRGRPKRVVSQPVAISERRVVRRRRV